MPSHKHIYLGITILLLFVSACGKQHGKATSQRARPYVDPRLSPAPDTTPDACEIDEEWDGNIRSGLDLTTLASRFHRRVFQRKSLAEGDVPVLVTATEKFDCVQASLRAQDSPRVVVDWTPLKEVSSMAHGGTLVTPAGGWYTLFVRAIIAGRVMTQINVTHIGVGEVFMVAGQSNSTFSGQTPQKSTTGLVSYFNVGKFIACDDAKVNKGYVDNTPGGAPWCLLGDSLTRALGVPILFDVVGWGGTRVAQWLPGSASSPLRAGHLFSRLLEHRQRYGPEGVRAVLWHQGESDAAIGTSRMNYRGQMTTVIDRLNEGAGFSTRWMIAEVSYLPNVGMAYRQPILNAQRDLVNDNTIFSGAETDGLIGAIYRHDGIHFNALGLAKHAKGWYEKITAAFFAP